MQSNFRYDKFAIIAKIWHSENFAGITKFSLCHSESLRNFHYAIAKFTVPHPAATVPLAPAATIPTALFHFFML